jgi:acetylornithine/succinyldiaminopimelate/putrescine aminotransferase
MSSQKFKPEWVECEVQNFFNVLSVIEFLRSFRTISVIIEPIQGSLFFCFSTPNPIGGYSH